MKRITSMLMVLTLVVGIAFCAPFAAFAEDEPHVCTFGSWQETKAPTCAEEGSQERSCTQEGCTEDKETEVIAKLAHTFGDWTEALAATCTEVGRSERTCGVCEFVETADIPAGHVWNAGTETTVATCETAGVLTKSCTREGCTETMTEDIAALGHDWDAGTVKTAPTCAAVGVLEKSCTREGCTETKEEEIAKLAHTFGDWAETLAATCTTVGSQERACSVCTEKETAEIDKLPHNYSATVTAPTCTADGFTTYACADCPANSTVDFTVALGHEFGEWDITKPASCAATGIREKSCTREGCTEKEIETIAVLAHSFGAWDITLAATCTTVGSQERVCAVCTEKETAELDKLAHAFGEWDVTAAATCTEAGSRKHICSVCNVEESEVIPVLGHDYSTASCTAKAKCSRCGEETGEVLGHDYSAATCTAKAKCSRCGDETGNALGHSYGAWTTTKAATCTVAGSRSKSCTHVGCTEKVTETIKALGHTGGKATCSAAAVCTRCKKSYGSLLAHKEKAAVTKATASKDGKHLTVCSVCNKTLKTGAVIPKASSITLSATTYTYDGKEKKPSVTVKDSKGKVLKNGTDYTVTYSAGLKNIGVYNVKITFKGNYSGTVTKTFKIIPRPGAGLKAAAKTSTSIKLTWTAQSGVEGYQIYDTVQKKVVATVKGANTNSVTISKLAAGKAYSYKVRSYKTVKDTKYYGAYSPELKTNTLPATPVIASVSSPKTRNLSVKWNKVASAAGYEVQYSTDKTFKSGFTQRNIGKNSTVSISSSEVLKGKTYYVRIRSYQTINGVKVYSPYSAVKSVMVK